MAVSTSPAGDILRLAALISQSALRVVQEYEEAGVPVPGLEETDPAAVLDTPAIREAVRVLEGATTQLLVSVAPPANIMATRGLYGVDPACIQVALRARVADQLRDGPKSVAELAKTAGISAINLGKVLRNLAVKHCFTEVETDVYANNRLSACLLSDRDTSALHDFATEEENLAIAHLSDALFKPEWTSIPTSVETSGYMLAFGKPIFKRYEVDPPRGERFGRAMLAWTKLNGGADEITRTYPWESVPKDVTFCDIGGGLGHVSMALLKAHPHLKVIVQDQPPVLEEAAKMWKEKFPDALTEQRARLEPINFLAGGPVEGCDFYYLKHILHDWPDADCIAILKNIRKSIAAGPGRLLIDEFILHDATRTNDMGGTKRAPAPLLPNFGGGAQLKYLMDVNMLASFGGVERTLDDLVSLGNASGFRFSKLWEEDGELSLLELVPV